MDPTSGAVIPGNFIPNTFIHFIADNIDIQDESLGGKKTFHAKQMAAYQRSNSRNQDQLASVKMSAAETLKVPEILQNAPVRISDVKEKQSLFFKSQSLSIFSRVATTNRTCSEKQN